MGPPKWLIEGILPRWSYGMLYGPSGSGKSFLALEMAICVATGANFHRRATRATGGAFYVAAEDPRDFPIRESAWRKYHGVPDRPAVRFLQGSLTLNLPGKAEKLAASILRIDPEPGIIVIDTLSATFQGNETGTRSTSAASTSSTTVTSCSGWTASPRSRGQN
ncbi:MAG: AAA family ATPase [Stellaceae bacterium]